MESKELLPIQVEVSQLGNAGAVARVAPEVAPVGVLPCLEQPLQHRRIRKPSRLVLSGGNALAPVLLSPSGCGAD
jgi:hypothetical protein